MALLTSCPCPAHVPFMSPLVGPAEAAHHKLQASDSDGSRRTSLVHWPVVPLVLQLQHEPDVLAHCVPTPSMPCSPDTTPSSREPGARTVWSPDHGDCAVPPLICLSMQYPRMRCSHSLCAMHPSSPVMSGPVYMQPSLGDVFVSSS